MAIRSIAETRALLALVVTSSESFDYPKAKLALVELQRKLRELDRAQRQLEKGSQPENVVPLELARRGL